MNANELTTKLDELYRTPNSTDKIAAIWLEYYQSGATIEEIPPFYRKWVLAQSGTDGYEYEYNLSYAA